MMNEQIEHELGRIKKAHSGVLDAHDVVSAAQPKNSILHDCFTWDDSEAAQQFRLWQARRLIAVTVTFDPQLAPTPIRAYVSLTSDRQEGGYRAMADILKDKDMRAQLLSDALDDMRRFQEKYAALKELADVFVVMEKAKLKKLVPASAGA